MRTLSGCLGRLWKGEPEGLKGRSQLTGPLAWGLLSEPQAEAQLIGFSASFFPEELPGFPWATWQG